MTGWAVDPGTSETIVAFLLKETLILAVGVASMLILRKASAAVRHATLVATMTAAIALPVLSGALPDWSVPLFDREETLVPVELTTSPTLSPRTPQRETVADAGLQRAVLGSMPIRPGRSQESALPLGILLMMWGAGSILLVGRYGLGLIRVAALTRDAVHDPRGPHEVLAARIADDLGIRRPIRVGFSECIDVPMTWGVARPVILLPFDAWELSAAKSRVGLLHELAHVRRNDWLTWAVVEAAWAMLWFHPLAWICRNRSRIELERACDDVVLASGARPVAYASVLVEVARSVRATPSTAVIPMARPSALRDRVENILGSASRRVRLDRRATAIVIGVAAAVLVPLAAAHLWSETTEVHERERLIAALADRDPAVREMAAWGLGARAAIEAVDPLVERLADPDPAVRGVAARALGKIGDRRAFESLVAGLDDTDPNVRELTLLGLAEIDDERRVDPIVRALQDPEKGVRSVAVSILNAIGGRAVIEPLINTAISDPDPHTRFMAIGGLGRIDGGRAVVPDLIGLLDDPAPEVRYRAVESLGRIEDPRAVPALVARVKIEPDEEIRTTIVGALTSFAGDPRAIDGLVTAAGDEAWRVRQTAVAVLAESDDPRVVPVLLEALRDPVHQVRLMAAWSLDSLEKEGS
jgi:HEAT repeat protein/beta-lactamase regulating signal transducer with metallopeptidase domain